MRRWAAVLLVTGCYAPRAAPGSPCDRDDQCPRALRCIADTCEPPGTVPPDDAAADTAVPPDARPWSAPVALRGVNSASNEDDPSLTPDGLTIAFVSSRNGSSDIFLGTRGNLDQPFAVAPVTAVNSASDESSPELSADGKTLYFTSDRAAADSPDVYVAHLEGGSWTMPAVVPQLSSPRTESDLAISPDGLTAVISRGNQFFLATRATATAAFGALAAMPALDIAGSPAAPTITDHADVVYFHAGAVRDLYVAYRTGDTFTPPAPITELNTAGREDGPFISPDGHHLYFAREGDLYEATR
jgi:dipeptidyl aminopeptidase/acylaminoacyl peptidase